LRLRMRVLLELRERGRFPPSRPREMWPRSQDESAHRPKQALRPRRGFFNPRRFAMMRLIIAAFVAVALFAATTVLRSHSISENDAAKMAMMPSVQELQHATDTSKLPAEVPDDRSVIYPQQPSR
jgi:hypothetical protein